MRIVVTGAGGFIGSYLVERLRARKDDVSAWVRPGGLAGRAKPGTVEVDLMEPSAVLSALKESRPDIICHFAAQSLPSVSWQKPRETMRNNVETALNLYDAARELRISGPILVAGSSSEYAEQRYSDVPIAEDHPVGATSPYAASKIAVDHLSCLYHKRYGLAIIRVRPFFWIGPGKTGDFCSDMARKIVQVERGTADSVKVGNLDPIRDLLDVRDGVEGLLTLLERGHAGEAYNLCSGVGMRMRDVLQTYLQMTSTAICIEVDRDLLRPLDEPVRIGDPSKIKALGWQSTRPIGATLQEILDHWRQRGP